MLGVFARRQLMTCKYAKHEQAACQEISHILAGAVDGRLKHAPVKNSPSRLAISIICYIFAELEDHCFEKYETILR